MPTTFMQASGRRVGLSRISTLEAPQSSASCATAWSMAGEVVACCSGGVGKPTLGFNSTFWPFFTKACIPPSGSRTFRTAALISLGTPGPDTLTSTGFRPARTSTLPATASAAEASAVFFKKSLRSYLLAMRTSGIKILHMVSTCQVEFYSRR